HPRLRSADLPSSWYYLFRKLYGIVPGVACAPVTAEASRRHAMSTEPRTEQPGDEGVLARLDSQVTSSFYWYLAILSCVGGFLFGYDTAVIGSGVGFHP